MTTVIVGAGFFGLTLAERIANELGQKVLVLEKRPHLGGNAFSFRDEETNIEIHKYGSHLFHTSNQRVWDYVNRFATFNSYVHRVVAKHGSQFFPMPVNLQTMSQIFGEALGPHDARLAVNADATSEAPRLQGEDNFETKALLTVGPRIYNALFRGYTHKQWQTDPRELPAETFSRLPVRYNFESRYFQDTFEGLPTEGYGTLFERMVENQLIEVRLNTDFFEWRKEVRHDGFVVYTGPLDRYYDYRFGTLGWRTLDFEFEKVEIPDFQGTSVVNYPDLDVPYTRIHEFKHFHPERPQSDSSTIIAREFSRVATAIDDPYYPINSPKDRALLNQYRSLARKETHVLFGGRLGSYLYLDMHMAIASALNMFDNELRPKLEGTGFEASLRGG